MNVASLFWRTKTTRSMQHEREGKAHEHEKQHQSTVASDGSRNFNWWGQDFVL